MLQDYSVESHMNVSLINHKKNDLQENTQSKHENADQEFFRYLETKNQIVKSPIKPYDEYEFQLKDANYGISGECYNLNHEADNKVEADRKNYTPDKKLIAQDESPYINPMTEDLPQNHLKTTAQCNDKNGHQYKSIKQGHLILAELENMVNRNEKQRLYMAERRRNLTPEQRVTSLEKGRIQKRILRHNESAEKRSLRLAKERAYKLQKRMNLTPEEKERELVKNRVYKRLQRVYESPEKRKLRLDRDRVRKSKKRLEQKIYSDISNKMYLKIDQK